ELGERLRNLGIRGRQIRHRAICVHLWHERGYAREDEIAANRSILEETKRSGRTWTSHGIEPAC
ncbi:MAG: glycosyltransferase family 2 protein, partial [Gemmatimonadota bacterium]